MSTKPSEEITALQEQLSALEGGERDDEHIGQMCLDLRNRLQLHLQSAGQKPGRRRRPVYMNLEAQRDPQKLARTLEGLSAASIGSFAASNQRCIAQAMESPDELERFDRLTPFFSEQLRRLSPQMSAVLNVFANCPWPLHAGEVASRVFFIQDTSVFAALRKLVRGGYLRCNKSDKNTRNTYEVADPDLLYYLVMRMSREFSAMVHSGANADSFTQISDCIARMKKKQ